MNTLVRKNLLLALLLVCGGASFAQSNILDGVYVKEHTIERKLIPYAHLREADVMWSKRVWRYLDLKEKMNHDLYFPKDSTIGRQSLMQLIWWSIRSGELTAYKHTLGAEGDIVHPPLEVSELIGRFNKIDTSYVDDIETGEQTPVYTRRPFNTSDVIGFKIKEDWFFDRQRSVMDVRIIAIAPVYETAGSDGGKRKETLFWVYFPEARSIFANHEVFNKSNDAERRTFDDIFWKRKFSSYVYKESNVYDRNISEYKNGADALLEADKIKEDIFVFEHDLWEY